MACRKGWEILVLVCKCLLDAQFVGCPFPGSQLMREFDQHLGFVRCIIVKDASSENTSMIEPNKGTKDMQLASTESSTDGSFKVLRPLHLSDLTIV